MLKRKVELLPLEAIALDPQSPRTPLQARNDEDLMQEMEALAALGQDIAVHGLVQPIVVHEGTDGRYQIIAGERRWRAFRLNRARGVPNSDHIPAVIHRLGQ